MHRSGRRGELSPGLRRLHIRARPAVQFRIIAGERTAENQQTERLVKRAMSREARQASLGRQFAFIERLVSRDLVHDPLRTENEKLKQELSQLRRILAKTHQATTNSRQPTFVEATRSVGELLTLTDRDEAEQLDMLLECGQRSVAAVVEKLGIEQAIRFSNLLGRSQVAVSNTGNLVLTALGVALGKSLNDLTSTPQEP
jgi:hypothetical protein